MFQRAIAMSLKLTIGIVWSRNEVDEEFRFVQQRFRKTVEELLVAQIKSKHPLKTETARLRLLQKKMQVRMGVQCHTVVLDSRRGNPCFG